MANKSIRWLAIVITVAFLFAALASNESQVQAKGGRIPVFGTVVSAPDDGKIDVATREGVITLVVNDETKIDTKKDHKKGTKRLQFDKVSLGDSVTGYYTEQDSELVANKLTFLDTKKSKISKHLKHVVGVVLKKSGKKLTIQTDDGEEVEVVAPDTGGNDETEEGSLVVAVVEEDEESGDLEATAIRTAAQTVERLNQAISYEISVAQQELLKTRISDTASAHLTRLYETLDEIQAETQAKIEAAFAEYQASYASTLDDNLLAPPSILISGEVISIDSVELIVAANDDGNRSSIAISGDVEVELLDGEKGAIADVVAGSFVEVLATPGESASNPAALLIKIVPAPETPNVDEGDEDDDTITGTIVTVCDSSSCNQTIIVIDNPNGSDSAAGVTDDTIVTGEGGDLEPGQEVEITLGDDGFTAEEVVVVAASETSATPTPIAGEDGAPAAPVEYSLRGIIRSFTGGSVVLDDVYLELNSILPEDTSMEVGQEIQFKVIVDDDGRWVIVGVGE